MDTMRTGLVPVPADSAPTPATFDSAFWMFATETLGTGCTRTVYAVNPRIAPGLVIKVEPAGRAFQNVIEWETWIRVRDTKHRRWFAPCVTITSNGSVLVMRRTQPATRYPVRMPRFLSDFKRRNFGMLDGHLVCHDYGVPKLMDVGMTSRMVKANWTDAR